MPRPTVDRPVLSRTEASVLDRSEAAKKAMAVAAQSKPPEEVRMNPYQENSFLDRSEEAKAEVQRQCQALPVIPQNEDWRQIRAAQAAEERRKNPPRSTEVVLGSYPRHIRA